MVQSIFHLLDLVTNMFTDKMKLMFDVTMSTNSNGDSLFVIDLFAREQSCVISAYKVNIFVKFSPFQSTTLKFKSL